jgi:hypothetical protein
MHNQLCQIIKNRNYTHVTRARTEPYHRSRHICTASYYYSNYIYLVMTKRSSLISGACMQIRLRPLTS